MKVNRHQIAEEYNTTVDWLSDFSRNIEKNADFISNVKMMVENRKKKFSTIDEKMQDIRKRVGFSSIESGVVSQPGVKKSAGCGCAQKKGEKPCCESCANGKPCEGCGKDKGKSDVPSKDKMIMDNILNYIIQYIGAKKEENLNVVGVLFHCREHPALGYRELESKINPDVLKKFISKLIDVDSRDFEKVDYVDSDERSGESADIPEFMEHSIPNI